MKRLSRLDIEAIADRYIKAYLKLPEIRDTQVYRVEPELFLDQVLKLNIEYLHLSFDGSLLGLTAFEPIGVDVLGGNDEEKQILLDGNTVLIEKDLRADNRLKGRKNFTIMHEGSHQIFKRLFPTDYCAGRNRVPVVHYYRANTEKSRYIRDWEEWQANALASAVLLPKQMIGQGMYLFGLGEKIDCLNKIYRPQEYEKFSALADFLGSSKKALAIRMKQLGLLRKEYLDNPFDMLTVQ